jgi:hypothetical protein
MTPNGILKLTPTLLLPLLLPLFNACWTLGYLPKFFRESTTLFASHYTQPKSYRPIALLNTVGKALEKIMATRISFAAEEFKMLPRR